MVITMPRGTQDILPEDSKKWQYIEDKLRKISDSFCCSNFIKYIPPIVGL